MKESCPTYDAKGRKTRTRTDMGGDSVSRVTYMNESCHTCEKSCPLMMVLKIKISTNDFTWVGDSTSLATHIHIWVSHECDTYERVTWHIQVSHCHIWLSHDTHTSESIVNTSLSATSALGRCITGRHQTTFARASARAISALRAAWFARGCLFGGRLYVTSHSAQIDVVYHTCEPFTWMVQLWHITFTHAEIDGLCHTCEPFTCTACVNVICRKCDNVTPHTWVCRAAHMKVSCHTCEHVMSHTWMHHVTHVNASCHTRQVVMSHVKTSCHTCEFVDPL